MNKNYVLFNDRVKGDKNILGAIRNLYYRLIKLYIKQKQFKKALNYVLDYKNRYKLTYGNDTK